MFADRRNWIVDFAIISATFCLEVIELLTTDGAWSINQLWWLAGRTILLVGMRRFPLQTLILVGVIGNYGVARGGFETDFDYVFTLALFSAALRETPHRRVAAIVVWFTIDTWYTVQFWHAYDISFGQTVSFVAEESMAWSAARWITTHNALLRELEATRDSQAAAAVTEEREVIAREIHDIVGHHLATIVLHAGAGRLSADRDPDAARVAFTAIEESGRTAMRETQIALGMLRETPTLTSGRRSIALLIAATKAAGVDVKLHELGDLLQLDAALDTTAYRVVQEALTNATKYGHGAIEVTLKLHDRELVIEIQNAVRLRERSIAELSSSGTGINGMRARVQGRGGTFEAGTRGRTFIVVAALPWPLP